ncbi:MAG: pyruvate:ferredoxin (flavodoxin) oxidoreductase, partial [Clostridiales bacterium]|nr:pyruvate:ferredoxin (flavodoxin) oxidoreductase [Clostridiales bacterium]
EYMDKVNKKIGTSYGLFNYYGAPDAEHVIIAMGSVCETIEETIDYLRAKGEKVGVVKVRLYRPFRADKLVEAIPASAKSITVLDRTKEPGSLGEPLYLDVSLALRGSRFDQTPVYAGRYGLGSKDTIPAHILSVYENAKTGAKARFTVGITDDVTYLSLPMGENPDTAAEGTTSCKFWGLGADGTVGANKNSIKIIGDHTDKYVQAYFQYDSKKTGGVTVSHLRFGDKPIRSPYYINKADFVACHNPSYITKHFPIVNDIKPGGTFLVNCQWSFEELEQQLSADAKKYMYDNKINLYMINAIDLAEKVGMGKRTNTVLQSAFFALANVLPAEDAIKYMKDAAEHSYLKKGRDVVQKNWDAIDAGATAFVKCEIPESWANPAPDAAPAELTGRPDTVKLVKEVMEPINQMNGYSLPVSAFEPMADGTFPSGASAYEKRGVAVNVVEWTPDKCVACNQCAFVCPHATLRAYALDADEQAAAPAQTKMTDFKVGAGKGKYKFALSVSPLDCMGCGVCVGVCPTKSLKMVPQGTQLDQQPVFDYCVANVSVKDELVDNTVKGSQFKTPLLEFSGSCAGCAESTYARIITQLFGDRMFISNATGCSSIWGGTAATSPYTVNKEGKGPAWANSLFEDNAEHGLGMYFGQKTIRESLRRKVEVLAEQNADVKAAADKWIETYDDSAANQPATKALIAALEAAGADDILAQKDYLNKKSCWIFGGDGWAYDIGYGGLDHVLASGEDINIFVFDTEIYSNTGGQASKSTNIGAVAQFAAAGKEVAKKSLSEIQMQYGYVYVAQVAMGANPAQCIKAMVEAEAYHGPSLIIGYSPCELHSIKGGMTNCQNEMKKAVTCGYWNLFRFNPMLKAEGKNPFILDSKEPKPGYKDFMMGEARFSALTRSFPDRAEKLFQKSEDTAMARYEHLVRLQELYK